MNNKTLLLLLLLTSCDNIEKNRQKEDIIFEKIYQPYLLDNLWDDQNAYDAGHYLLVPLYYAFNNNNNWKQYFHEHIVRFIKNKQNLSTNRLNRLQYIYFLSNYLKLAKKDSYPVDSSLYSIIYQEVDEIWKAQAPTWGQAPFTSMEERVKWKLSNLAPQGKSYYNVILDEELFVMAIAADLKTFLLIDKKEIPSLLSKIISFANSIFETRLKWDDQERCYFQAGYWTDHPDYIYAGNINKVIGMSIKKVTDIGEDISHSHRLPIWLLSFQDSYFQEPSYFNFYEKVRNGLAKQFIDKVVVVDSNSILTKNFLNGSNGVYRWNYSTLNNNDGYGSFELSGTFLIGWWSFLENSKISGLYKTANKSFPLNNDLLPFYIDKTNRDRNIFVKYSETNGMKELITLLASKLYL